MHSERKGIPVSAVAEIVDPVFRGLYTIGNEELHDRYQDIYGSEGLEVFLQALTDAEDDAVIDALIDALIAGDSYWPPDGEEAFYSREFGYIEQGDRDNWLSHSWNHFTDRILHEERFFSDGATNTLKELFNGIHLLKSASGRPAVYEIKPGTNEASFYRARLASDDTSRRRIASNPSAELGAPPAKLRRGGRMNASGILAFYAAFDLQTCIAELRPAVGDTVAAARFEVVRPILVLDMTAFADKPKSENVFSRNYVEKLRLWKFMSIFMNEVSQPYIPGVEHLTYIPTQVVSEYLTRIHTIKHEGTERSLDGIIYQSAQNGSGRNIVIFGDAGMNKETKTTQHRGNNAALRFVEGSLSAHEVVGVRYDAENRYMPLPQRSKKRSWEDAF